MCVVGSPAFCVMAIHVLCTKPPVFYVLTNEVVDCTIDFWHQFRCSRCLGMIGAIDPQLVSMKTLLPLKIPESEVSLVATLTEHLVRVLFSADLQTVEAASHALGQVLEVSCLTEAPCIGTD